jgi:hypothetical protein
VDQHSLQLMIRQKLTDGRLPFNSIPRVWGGPGKDETCDACDVTVAKEEFVIEGISLAKGRKPLQLHVECFYLWDQQRHVVVQSAQG